MSDAQANAPQSSQARAHIGYFDTLRAIAIVAVVVLHVAAWDWYRMPPESSGWQTLNVIDSIVRFCVPIFFMVSGALFLDPRRTVTLSSVFRKSLPRLLVPFIVWSVFFAVFSVYGPGGTGGVADLAYRAVIGHYHLWFLIALGGLYLATPLLRAIVAQRHIAWYFVGLAAVFASVFPLLRAVPVAGKVLGVLLDTMRLELVLGYSLYFVLGYLLHTARLTRRGVQWCVAAGAIGAAVTATATAWVTSAAGSANAMFYEYLTPNVVLTSVAVFVGVRWLSEQRAVPKPSSALVRTLSKYSLGIYLVHPAFQTLLQAVGVTAAWVHPVVSVPLVSLAVLIPSLITALLVRRIPRVGAYLS